MVRVNGQNWKPKKAPFRPGSGQTTYAKRMADTKARALTKAHENELKDEKEAERQRRMQALKDKRAAKAEKERYELMALKMHKKRVERLRRREKRNKLINS